ncbi:unnamed protein product [Schistosoma curassoni]|uniref:METMALONYL_COA_MUTASE domain-containing protein n=1 Tax=Schistosoma curassoni TaxID=6186 RepID=A0A183KZ50_9TREM|nr:unnamed protein product [Schistosoma curassoni]
MTDVSPLKLEISMAIRQIKSGKTAGPNRVPDEVRYRGSYKTDIFPEEKLTFFQNDFGGTTTNGLERRIPD